MGNRNTIYNFGEEFPNYNAGWPVGSFDNSAVPMAPKLTLTQHLANAASQATARGLSQEATSRVLQDARDRWESRLNTLDGRPDG